MNFNKLFFLIFLTGSALADAFTPGDLCVARLNLEAQNFVAAGLNISQKDTVITKSYFEKDHAEISARDKNNQSGGSVYIKYKSKKNTTEMLGLNRDCKVTDIQFN